MTTAEILASGIQYLDDAGANAIVEAFRSSGRSVLAIDGFMGTGKTWLADKVATALGVDAIHLDDFLPENAPSTGDRYVDRLDAPRLVDALSDAREAPVVIVEGVFLRELLDGKVPEVDVFWIYAATVTERVPGQIVWHEGARVEMDEYSANPFEADLERYHREWRPHERSDAVALRDADMAKFKKPFTSPDGQEFRISAEIWRQTGIGSWHSLAIAYRSSDATAALKDLSKIRPPRLVPTGGRTLNEGRMFRILKGFAEGEALPPVPVYREPGAQTATLLDGTHRYFASVAAGFLKIPVVYVSRTDAEVRYRYPQGQA